MCGRGLAAIAEACARLPSLTSLRAERADRALSKAGLEGLARCLVTAPALARLAVGGDAAGIGAGAGVGAALAPALSSARKLVSLRLAAARLDDAQAALLAPGIKDAPSLRELHVERNGLGPAGVRHLLLRGCLARPAGRALWTMSFADQQPPLRRADVRDAARDVDLESRGAARLHDAGSVPVDDAYGRPRRSLLVILGGSADYPRRGRGAAAFADYPRPRPRRRRDPPPRNLLAGTGGATASHRRTSRTTGPAAFYYRPSACLQARRSRCAGFNRSAATRSRAGATRSS